MKDISRRVLSDDIMWQWYNCLNIEWKDQQWQKLSMTCVWMLSTTCVPHRLWTNRHNRRGAERLRKEKCKRTNKIHSCFLERPSSLPLLSSIWSTAWRCRRLAVLPSVCYLFLFFFLADNCVVTANCHLIRCLHDCVFYCLSDVRTHFVRHVIAIEAFMRQGQRSTNCVCSPFPLPMSQQKTCGYACGGSFNFGLFSLADRTNEVRERKWSHKELNFSFHPLHTS